MTDKGKIVAFDVETTGISKTSRIVEIAAIRFDAKYIYDEFETLVDPLMPIPYGAWRIHRIDDYMIEGKPTAGEALTSFLDFIAADDILVAHYAEFDVSIIAAELKRHGLPEPKNPVFDSCRLARRFLQFPNYKLDTLRDSLGPWGADRHRAYGDCLAAIEVVRACMEVIGSHALRMADLLHLGVIVRGFNYFDHLGNDMPDDKHCLLESFRKRQPVAIEFAAADQSECRTEVIPETFYWFRDDLYMEAVTEDGATVLSLRIGDIRLTGN